MADTSGSSLTYFAASSKAELGRRIFEKLSKSTTADSELKSLWSACYSHYFPAFDDGSGSSAFVTRAGANGELAAVRIARARRLALAAVGIVVGANPDWEPRAINRSSTSRSSVTLGRSILDYVWQLKGLEDATYLWAEQAFALSESFMFAEWDMYTGEEAGIDDSSGLIQHGGDLTLHTIPPWDTARDPTSKSFDSGVWLGIRLWRNKWDLAAQHPKDINGEETREKILSVHNDATALAASGVGSDFLSESDLVPVWYFFHKPTTSLPKGREVVLVSPQVVLRDIPLSYDGIPVVRLAPAERFDTPYGYTPFFDGMGPQEVLDGMDSSVATNFLTLSVQAIALGTGTKVRPERTFGMQTLEVPSTSSFVPQGINMVKNPPEAQKFIDSKAKEQQQLFGLNDVYMGNPDTAQMNAQAFALLSSMAVQANSPFQKKFLAAIGKIGTLILKTYAKRVTKERLIPVLGKSDGHLMQEASFTGEDLKGIDQVFVKAGNALEQTLPGRLQLLTAYQTAGFVTQPEHIQQVIETGRPDVATHATRDEQLLIEYENEMVLQGESPPVHAFHNHLLHGKEHACPLLNPQGLADPKVVEATQKHIEAHYIEYFGLVGPVDPLTGQPMVDPATGAPMTPQPKADPQWPVRIRMLLGQMPPPMAPMPPPGGDPNAPQGGGMEPPGAAPPGGQGTNGVTLPTPPPNPITGAGPAGAPEAAA